MMMIQGRRIVVTYLFSPCVRRRAWMHSERSRHYEKTQTTLPQSPESRLLSLPQSDPRHEKLDNQHVVGLSLSLSLSLFLSLSPLSVAKYGKKVLPTTRQAAVLAASGSGSNASAGSGFVVVVVASGRARHSGCMKTNGRDEWKSSQWHPMDESASTL
jgi:hypothetical protein